MVALNAAMMTDGVVIEVFGGTQLSRPLHIVHIAASATPAAMFTRSSLRLGKGARATLVESFIAAEGVATYQVHDCSSSLIGDDARLDHVRLVEDAATPSTSPCRGRDAWARKRISTPSH